MLLLSEVQACECAVKRADVDTKEAWIKKTAEAANVDCDGREMLGLH